MRSTVFSLALGTLSAAVLYHSVQTAHACSCITFASERLYLGILQLEQLDGQEADLAAEEARLSGELALDGNGDGTIDLHLEADDDLSSTRLTFQMSE
jgi:hypothetical protein